MSTWITAGQLSTELQQAIARHAPEIAAQPELHERLVELLGDHPNQLLQPMSYDEFLTWAIQEDIRAEWADGKVYLMSPASSRHQFISGFLFVLLTLFCTERKLGVVMQAPFQMRLRRPPRGREPDVLFIAQAHVERIQRTYLDGPADLVIEIVSPESTGRDRGEKYQEYEEAGIPEYWLIDPLREQAEIYRLEQDRYHLLHAGRSGRVTSLAVPGFWLDLAWLWPEPLPPVTQIWAELQRTQPQADPPQGALSG